MIGKVIEGRYAGSSVNKLSDRNVLFIQTEDGTKVALSKNNAISIDDVSEQYPSCGRKVIMVIWNDFETSIIQIGKTKEQTKQLSVNGAEHKESTIFLRKKDRKQKAIIIHLAVLVAVLLIALLVSVRFISNKKTEPQGQAIVETQEHVNHNTQEQERNEEEEKINRYASILQQINNSEKGEKKLWDSVKTDTELKEYILANIDDEAVVNLYKENNRWYGNYIFDVIEDIFSIGVEKVSPVKIQYLLESYMRSRDMDYFKMQFAVEDIGKMYEEGAYEEIKQYIYDIRSGRVYSGNPKDDITEFLLGRVEIKIKSMLKDPNSYSRTSYSCNVALDEETGIFEADITIYYTATNSFGGRVSDSYSITCDGTFVDGKVSLGD